ncbi:hypothetical protein QFW77_01190 [Luteimonas sp. RD2P54]|uniref:PilN domain-containing protein n=1 Tax=Luteimonas endophytica TaxID=3042023 RepID=A0ABT6J460_9GAMM|nr:hypothetical protein [Luteimonas endophytica]MDH5821609.1 hypothetical protein [Luteimonas endophytica]
MNRLLVVQQQHRWLVFDGTSVRRFDARPRLDRPAIVISDFGGAGSNVISLEGSPAHAVALIEKRLRSDGLIDGESKILIHKSRSMGGGYQTLFTAIELDAWQQNYSWAESQADHCLLIPVTSLLWHATGTGQGLVLHSGNQISALAVLKHSIVYRSALAYSDEPADLLMTAGALAEQFAADLEDGEDDAERLTMRWCSVLAGREDGADDPTAALREVFSARSGMQVAAVPSRRVVDESGRGYDSAIDWLAAAATPLIAVNRPTSRIAYVAERVLPLASAASLLIALSLAALSGRWALNASEANGRAERLSQEVQQIDMRIAAMQQRQTVPEGFDGTLTLVERAAALQGDLDPEASLRLVRSAAAGDVRILRLRLDTQTEPPAPGAIATGPIRTLRVDGMVEAGRGRPGMQIADFVERLRQQGFDPVPADPQSNLGTQGSGSFFSYLLRPRAAAAVAGGQR